MNSLSEITQYNWNVQTMNLFIGMCKMELLDGNHDPLEIMACLKTMETIVKELKEAVKEDAISEADKHPEKKFDLHGVHFTKSSKKNWNFEDCGSSKLTDAVETKKAQEKMLKALTKPVFDEDTGEELKPATYTTTEFLKIEHNLSK